MSKVVDKDLQEAVLTLARQESAFATFVSALEKDLSFLEQQYERAKEELVLSGDNRHVALMLKGRITQLSNLIDFLTSSRKV